MKLRIFVSTLALIIATGSVYLALRADKLQDHADELERYINVMTEKYHDAVLKIKVLEMFQDGTITIEIRRHQEPELGQN